METEDHSKHSVSVYTVANQGFFPGLLGLVSSLRFHGHEGPIVIADAGLTSAQAEALSSEAVLVQLSPGLPPIYAKSVAPLEHPDDVMIFLDADMLCVRPLDELVVAARGGSILVVEDIGRPELSEDIWQQWEERLELGPLWQTTYINGGFFALPRDSGIAFFKTLAECLDRIDPSETHLRAEPTRDFSLPFFLADQDIANAVLASARFRERVMILPCSAAPHAPFSGISLASGTSCVDQQGETPFFLHHALQKPWSEPLPTNPYTELLVKYIHDPAAPNVSKADLPLFLRHGRVASAARALRSGRGRARAHVRGRLGLRPYLRARLRG
jgi:hypothetical protein